MCKNYWRHTVRYSYYVPSSLLSMRSKDQQQLPAVILKHDWKLSRLYGNDRTCIFSCKMKKYENSYFRAFLKTKFVITHTYLSDHQTCPNKIKHSTTINLTPLTRYHGLEQVEATKTKIPHKKQPCPLPQFTGLLLSSQACSFSAPPSQPS